MEDDVGRVRLPLKAQRVRPGRPLARTGWPRSTCTRFVIRSGAGTRLDSKVLFFFRCARTAMRSVLSPRDKRASARNAARRRTCKDRSLTFKSRKCWSEVDSVCVTAGEIHGRARKRLILGNVRGSGGDFAMSSFKTNAIGRLLREMSGTNRRHRQGSRRALDSRVAEAHFAAIRARVNFRYASRMSAENVAGLAPGR